MERVPSKHANGAVYFRLTSSETLDFNNYFVCLQHLRPLFDEQDFKSSVAGFYINYIADPSVQVPQGALRVVYFSTDNLKTIAAIDTFVEKNKDTVQIINSSGAYNEKTVVLTESDKERLRFWNNLNDSTHIGLDLLTVLGPTTTHAILYHYGTIFMPQGIMPRDFLEPFYRRNSGYYRDLEKNGLAEIYWDDLTRWFDKDLPLHFPFNMLLGPSEHAFKHLLGSIGKR